MRALILFLIFLLPMISLGQAPTSLKKRYLGTYKGEISAYQTEQQLELIDVAATPISIEIEASTVVVTIGNRRQEGNYIILFEADDYYLLDATMTDQAVNERIMVYKKGKKLSRDGMYPQPVSSLKKSRK